MLGQSMVARYLAQDLARNCLLACDIDVNGLGKLISNVISMKIGQSWSDVMDSCSPFRKEKQKETLTVSKQA
jgi:hypothetical protein